MQMWNVGSSFPVCHKNEITIPKITHVIKVNLVLSEFPLVIPQDFLKTLATEYGVSDTELKALWLAVGGCSTTAIAQKLEVSEDAVRKRLSEVYQKFKVPGSGSVKLTRLQQLLLSRYQEYLAQSSSSSNLVGSGRENTYPRQVWGEAPDVSVF